MLDFLSGWWSAIRAALNLDFFQSLAFGMVVALAIVALLVLWRIPKPKDYFTKDPDGKNAAVGLFGAVPVLKLLCIAFVVLLVSLSYFFAPSAHAASSSALFPGTWFNDARLYMGVDYARKPSAHCWAGGHDDRTASNMGLVLNVWESQNERVRFNGKYRHNSCAINRDRNTTDAIGVEVEILLWCRKCR